MGKATSQTLDRRKAPQTLIALIVGRIQMAGGLVVNSNAEMSCRKLEKNYEQRNG